MEDILYPSVLWQLQPVGYRTDPFQHLKRTSILGPELLACPWSQGLSRVVQETHPNPVPNVEL